MRSISRQIVRVNFALVTLASFPAFSQTGPSQQVFGVGNAVVQGAYNSSIAVTVNNIYPLVGGEQHIHFPPDQAKLISISHELGVTREAAAEFSRILTDGQVRPELAIRKLAEAATTHKRLLEELRAIRDVSPQVIELLKLAIESIDKGEYNEAGNLLQKAHQVDIVTWLSPNNIAETRLSNNAAIKAGIGHVALTQLHYDEAATYFGQAYTTVPANHAEKRREYLQALATACYRKGDEKGDKSALVRAADLYRQLLLEIPKEQTPLELASVQNDLGLTLVKLGELQSETLPLEEAVSTYRDTLKETNLQGDPVKQAEIQNNFGLALTRLGERNGDGTLLKEAIGAFRAALNNHTQKLVPI